MGSLVQTSSVGHDEIMYSCMSVRTLTLCGPSSFEVMLAVLSHMQDTVRGTATMHACCKSVNKLCWSEMIHETSGVGAWQREEPTPASRTVGSPTAALSH